MRSDRVVLEGSAAARVVLALSQLRRDRDKDNRPEANAIGRSRKKLPGK